MTVERKCGTCAHFDLCTKNEYTAGPEVDQCHHEVSAWRPTFGPALQKARKRAFMQGYRSGRADVEVPAKPPMTMEQLERLLLFGEAPDGKEDRQGV